jgi:hypothetical protein
MLVKFQSDAGASVLMFGDMAQTLLKMMGTSGTVPGAILGKDVAGAGARQIHGREVPAAPGERADEAARIDLATRAFSLVELLTAAAKEQADVLWEQAH